MSRRVLFGVLNWGLGHATRSSVLIKELEAQGLEVIIASDGVAGAWLRSEFPHLLFLELPAYGIRYSKSNRQWPQLLLALPRLARVASAERQLAEIWAEDYQVSGVISDNRLGFRSSKHPSVYISHQLKPKAAWFSRLAHFAHRHYYQKYSAIWVPDGAGSKLSLALSKDVRGLRYLGMLSALEPQALQIEIPALIVLSGPEPQRSVLEAKLMEQESAFPDGSVLVRGTDSPCPERYKRRLKVYDRLGSTDLSRIISKAEIVISRSGYSSLMDYRVLGKKALLIPTPGQYEQEYLAKKHHGRFGWLTAGQQDLQLAKNLADLQQMPAPEPCPMSLPKDLFKLF